MNEHVIDIAIKLNRANNMLYKVREFVNIRVLNLLYHAIFDCYLNQENTVWGQNKNSLKVLILITEKSTQ